MATITVTIPDAQLPRVVKALCAAGGYADVSAANARQYVVDYIITTVTGVEHNAWKAAQRAERGPSPVDAS